MRFRDFPNAQGTSGFWRGRIKVVKIYVNDQWGAPILRGIVPRYRLWIYGEEPLSRVEADFPDNTVYIARERPA